MRQNPTHNQVTNLSRCVVITRNSLDQIALHLQQGRFSEYDGRIVVHVIHRTVLAIHHLDIERVCYKARVEGCSCEYAVNGVRKRITSKGINQNTTGTIAETQNVVGDDSVHIGRIRLGYKVLCNGVVGDLTSVGIPHCDVRSIRV